MNRDDGNDDQQTAPDTPFLHRWSQRKLDAKRPAVPEPAIDDDTPQASPPQAAEPEPEPPGDEDMPPVESLGPDSDISEFFSPKVSEALRQAALQQIFRQPQFNYSDGLDVYCGDYRNFRPLGDIVTAAMRHRLEVVRERLARLTESGQVPATAADHNDTGEPSVGDRPNDQNNDPDNDDDDHGNA